MDVSFIYATKEGVKMRCDFCKMRGIDRIATVDGKTQAGPWAGMCDVHFEQHGVGLGVGKGQRLDGGKSE